MWDWYFNAWNSPEKPKSVNECSVIIFLICLTWLGCPEGSAVNPPLSTFRPFSGRLLVCRAEIMAQPSPPPCCNSVIQPAVTFDPSLLCLSETWIYSFIFIITQQWCSWVMSERVWQNEASQPDMLLLRAEDELLLVFGHCFKQSFSQRLHSLYVHGRPVPLFSCLHTM